MKLVKIQLNSTESVKNFVAVVNKYPFEMDLKAGRFVIDAKSLLGIFSLDLSKPVNLEIYSDEADELLNDLKDFIVK